MNYDDLFRETACVRIKKGTGRTLKAGGAWIYDNEIDAISGDFENGDLVTVEDFDGYPLGHGCEYVGIEALNRLKKELDPAGLSGRVILLPLVNPEGFYMGAKQTIPADGQNLNRMTVFNTK